MATSGIRRRHTPSCPAKGKRGARCSCPYMAEAYDRRVGRKARRTFTSHAEAVEWRRKMQAAIERGEAAARRGPTVRAAGVELVAGMRSGAIRTRSGEPYKPSVCDGYERSLARHVSPALGARLVADVRRRDVQALVDRLVALALDASTVRNAILPLRVIFRRAVRDELVTVNPTRELDLPAVRGRRDRIATPDEARRLIAALPPADRVVWALAFYAGLRRGELLALRWRDVDMDAGRITVERAWCSHSGTFTEPKSGAGRRVVPAAGELRRLVLEHRLLVGAASREPDALVIAGRFPGRPASASIVGTRAREAWQSADLDSTVTLHAARHTYASLMVAARVGFKELQVYMGHSSITVTLDRYSHLLPGALADDARLLDALLDASE